MHALVRRVDRQVVAEAALEGSDQFVALIPVHQAHAADVRCKMSLLHEGGDDAWLMVDGWRSMR